MTADQVDQVVVKVQLGAGNTTSFKDNSQQPG